LGSQYAFNPEVYQLFLLLFLHQLKASVERAGSLDPMASEAEAEAVLTVGYRLFLMKKHSGIDE